VSLCRIDASHLRRLADGTRRRDISSRATASHTTALHWYPNTYASKLIYELGQSDVSVLTNPLANVIVQGRYDEASREWKSFVRPE